MFLTIVFSSILISIFMKIEGNLDLKGPSTVYELKRIILKSKIIL
jgi:hypothetical protein